MLIYIIHTLYLQLIYTNMSYILYNSPYTHYIHYIYTFYIHLIYSPYTLHAYIYRYAFGMLAWETLSGERPFSDLRSEGVLCSRVHKGIRPPIELLPPNTPADIVGMYRDICILYTLLLVIYIHICYICIGIYVY